MKWLSRAWYRGCVRTRKICSGLRTIMGWDHPFSAYTGVIPHSDDYTRPIDPDGQLYLPLHRGDLFTTTVRRSTYVSKIQETNSG